MEIGNEEGRWEEERCKQTLTPPCVRPCGRSKEPKGQERKGTQNLACVASLECQILCQVREMEERREGAREQDDLLRDPVRAQVSSLYTTLPDSGDPL